MQERQDAAVIARDILAALSEPFNLSTGHEVFIGGSIGISLFPDNGTTVAELTKNADAAMYLAKENGRNQFSFYTPELNADARKKLELENDLRRAVLHHELRLHYQPKVDIGSGSISGAEALVRWKKPDGSWISPSQFIPVAEKSGVILTIGNWVIEQACSQIRDWQNDGLPEMCVAVNVSARQFRSGHLDKLVKEMPGKIRSRGASAGTGIDRKHVDERTGTRHRHHEQAEEGRCEDFRWTTLAPATPTSAT